MIRGWYAGLPDVRLSKLTVQDLDLMAQDSRIHLRAHVHAPSPAPYAAEFAPKLSDVVMKDVRVDLIRMRLAPQATLSMPVRDVN